MEAAKLKSYLECPICFLLPTGRIFSCVNSHQICESCHDKLVGGKHCPQDCEFNNPPHRARVCEAMSENSDFEQNCSKPGCDVEIKKDHIAAHKLECVFRTVPCPDTACQKEILYNNMDLHVKESHQLSHSANICTLLLKDTILNYYNSVLFMYQENGVQFHPVFVKRNYHWYFWVSIKGGPEVASTWVFTAKVKNDERKIFQEFSG